MFICKLIIDVNNKCFECRMILLLHNDISFVIVTNFRDETLDPQIVMDFMTIKIIFVFDPDPETE